MPDYPIHTNVSADPIARSYRDEAAVELYGVSNARELVAAAVSLHKAIRQQTAKLEEFHNTPFSEANANLISTTVAAIERIELQLERWHHLIYPNQKPDSKA